MPSQHAFYLVSINMSWADVEASFGGATGSAGILRSAQSGFWAVGMVVGDLWMWLQLMLGCSAHLVFGSAACMT